MNDLDELGHHLLLILEGQRFSAVQLVCDLPEVDFPVAASFLDLPLEALFLGIRIANPSADERYITSSATVRRSTREEISVLIWVR